MLERRVVRHLEKDPVKQASIRKVLWRAAIIIPLPLTSLLWFL